MTHRPWPELRTPRLVLNIPSPDDARAMLDFQRRNTGHFEQWSPRRPDAFYTEAFWRARLAMHREEFQQDRSMCLAMWCDTPEGRLIIGETNFRNIVRGAFQACHLGYGIDATFEGQGLMREALEAAIQHAFDGLGLHRVMANYIPHNARSGQLLKRLGFEVEGYARDYLFINGAWEDHILTARRAPPRTHPRSG